MRISSENVKWCRFALALVFFPALSAIAEADSTVIDFIVSEQLRNAKSSEEYSYRVLVTGEDRSDELVVPVNSIMTVVRHGESILITREHNVVNEFGEGRREVSREISRLVMNDEILAEWIDATKASIVLYDKSDWHDAEAKLELSKLVSKRLGDDPLSLHMRIGNDGTLQSAVESSRQDGSNWKWAVDSHLDGNGDALHYTLARSLEGESRPDLTVKIDPHKGCAVTESVFEPYNQSDGYKKISKKEYRQVGDAWILARMENIVQTRNSLVPRTHVVTILEDFKWMSNAVFSPITLASLELPERVLAKKVVPVLGSAPRAEGLFWLQGGKLTPVDDVPQALASHESLPLDR